MIDIAYFTHRDVRVPEKDDFFKLFLKEQERECLRLVLGERLYNLYDAELDAQGNLKTTSEQKWQDLVNGVTVNDKVWRGFVEKDVKRSFLAYFVYVQWCFDDEAQSFGTGKQVSKVENSVTVSNAPFRIAAYNKFVEWVAGLNYGDKYSLYEYLYDHKDDFPEWEGTQLEYENKWTV